MSIYEYIYIEVEDNENCDYMPMQVYEPQAEPRPVTRVLLEDPDRPHGVYEVTGWSSEGTERPSKRSTPPSPTRSSKGASRLRRGLGRSPQTGRTG